jgi:hypothetical protein
MSKLTITCESFRPYRRNTLHGFCEILISELRLRIRDVALHQKGSARWAALPSKPQLKDGVQIKDETGKAQYTNIMEFTGREVRDAFSAAVVRAVLEREPSAFDDEQPAQSSKQSAPLEDPIPF